MATHSHQASSSTSRFSLDQEDFPMTSPQTLLTLSSQRDRSGNAIILVHSEALPESGSPLLSSKIHEEVTVLETKLPPSGPLTLVYCHGYLAEKNAPSLGAVRAFRAAWDAYVPLRLRQRLSKIIALHVSFVTRSHIYASSFRLQAGEWSKLVYCDLIVDLEKILGVDCLLLGLRDHDLQYDEEMKHWVGRQDEQLFDEATKKAKLDPSKPLINTQDVSFEWKEAASSENHSVPQPSAAEP